MKKSTPNEQEFKKLIKLDEKIWDTFTKYKVDTTLVLNQQFFKEYFKYQNDIPNSIYLKHLIAKQGVIYRTLKCSKEQRNGTVAKDNEKFMFYETDLDTNEVLSFYGYFKSTKLLNIGNIYKHIDDYLDKYKYSFENVSVLVNYDDKSKSDDYIVFEVSYDNDGIINIHLDKYGVFHGESLSLLKDSNFDYENDFLGKIKDIQGYLKRI